jgi:hypothetical protein
MLLPIFFSRVESIDNELSEKTLVVTTSPLPTGITYQVTGYAQIDNYTLIKWQQGDKEEYFTGETLWRGNTPIAMTGGVLQLYSAPSETKSEYPPETNIWSRVDGNIGNYGLSSITAIALRSSENTIYF